MGDVTPQRLQLVEALESRDTTTQFDSKYDNCILEVTKKGVPFARKRAGTQIAFTGVSGQAQGITNYLNNLYSISGDFLASFATSTGLTATRATAAAGWGARVGAMSVGFNGKLWVMGGWTSGSPLNDVWNSTDGINWSLVNSSAPWAARGKGVAIVFNNAIYIMGGAVSATGTHFKDVWFTTDGIHWTQATANAWPGRRRPSVCLFNNLMWIAGGQGPTATSNNWPNTYYSDVWYTSDGVHWTQTVSQAPWVARSNFAFFGINGRLRVLGGTLTDPFLNATSDLWSSADGISWTRDNANPFGVASSGVWPVAAFNSAGQDFPIPSPITISGGTGGSGATAWSFTDFDDDSDDDVFGGQYDQVTFNAAGSGYTQPPNVAFGTNVGFNAGAYSFLNGTSTGGNKLCSAAQLGATVYILEWDASGTFDHVLWTTTDGVTYTNAAASFPTGWTPREGEWFAYGNLWFLDGFDGTTYYNDVWFFSPGGSTFALNPTVPLGFYHFNQTSATVTQPLLVFKSTGDLFDFNANLNILTKLTSSANYPATTVPGLVYLDGYFFVMDPQGRIWNSGINDPTTWTALGFIAMQNEPNGGVAIAKLDNYVVGFGQWTTEWFYDNANPSPGSPLSPNTTFPFQVGCANGETVLEMQNSIVWVGQTKREGQGVYMFESNQPVRISTPVIDRILQADPLINVHAINLDTAGYSVYLLHLYASNLSLCYNFATKLWSVWTSTAPRGTVPVQSLSCDAYNLVTIVAAGHGLSDGDPVTISGATVTGYNGLFNAQVVDTNTFQYLVTSALAPNPGTAVLTGYTESLFNYPASAQVRDIDYLQDPLNGVIYSSTLTNYVDNGNPINVRIVTERWDGGTSEWKTFRRITILGDFVGSAAMLAYSDNDYNSYSSFRTLYLNQGQRATTTQCGRSRRRAFQIRHTAATPFRAEALELEAIKGGF